MGPAVPRLRCITEGSSSLTSLAAHETGTEPPFEPDTLALSMSTGKGVMATLLHQMVDRGLVDLEVPGREILA